MDYKNRYPDVFDHALGLSEKDLQGIKDNEAGITNEEAEPVYPKDSSYGSCWWCSCQQATLNYTSWYDSYGYYRYYNTCSCPHWAGCGSHGYVRNDYCSHCNPGYPTMTITQRTNNLGLTTGSGRCSLCGYSYTYYY